MSQRFDLPAPQSFSASISGLPGERRIVRGWHRYNSDDPMTVVIFFLLSGHAAMVEGWPDFGWRRDESYDSGGVGGSGRSCFWSGEDGGALDRAQG